mmetsp:Transcript_59495/g.159010  ORF Transcript_59495/g.159010 Transcript_59495/m.159010 type:complete len:394 (+) Transcript_59495:481-1662(+)
MSGKKAELVARLREEGTEAVEEDEDEDDEEDEGEVQRAGGGSDWLKKGADVDVKHENVWYTCKVLDVQEGGELVTVLYYDGEDEEEGVEVSKRVRALRPTWVKEGMKVEVDSEEVFYECTVEKISSDWKYCTVKYTDGGEVEEDVDIRGRLRRWRPPWIEKGMRVEVEYQGDYYAGEVTKVSKDKTTCSVTYDEEGEEDEDDIDVRQRVRQLPVSLGSLQRGDMLIGRVTSVKDFGAFVNVGAVRDGLVHVSSLAESVGKREGDPGASPEDVVQVGEELAVYVRSSTDKLALQMSPGMSKNEARRGADVTTWLDVDKDTWLPGKVTNVVDRLGIFVEVSHPSEGTPIEGLVHLTRIANEYVESVFDYAEVDEEVEVRVDMVDAKMNRIGFSMV